MKNKMKIGMELLKNEMKIVGKAALKAYEWLVSPIRHQLALLDFSDDDIEYEEGMFLWM